MTDTVTIDAAGRLVLPKAFRDRLHLEAGTKLRASIVADRIELTPEADERIRVVRKGKRLVIAGGNRPADIVAAIKSDREDRDGEVSRRIRGR
jgi:AbrB family looped-hinge helix DNA binding protein